MLGVEGSDIGSHHITSKNIIPCLFPVTIDYRFFALKELRDKYCHHSGLSLGRLSRSIDICIAQCNVRQPKSDVIVAEIEFPRKFTDSVGTQRQCLMLLSGRDRLTVAVNGHARRGTNGVLHAHLLTRLKQVDKPYDIDARIEDRLRHGMA